MNTKILADLHHRYHHIRMEMDDMGDASCNLEPRTENETDLALEIGASLAQIWQALKRYDDAVVRAIGETAWTDRKTK